MREELLEFIQGDEPFKIVHGEALSVLMHLPDASIDALITDPPYSSGGAFRSDRMQSTGSKYIKTGVQLEREDFTGDNRDQRAFLYWCALWLSEALRSSKPGAPGVLCIDWRQLPSLTDSFQAGGWVWRGIAVWDKTEAVRKHPGRYSSQAEYLVWGSNGPMPIREDIGTIPGVFRVYRDQESRLHQTGKPVPLMLDILRICPPGGVVLDPFMGSASTGVAAIRSGRRFLGIDASKTWVSLAGERLQAEVNGLTLESARAEQRGLFAQEEA